MVQIRRENLSLSRRSRFRRGFISLVRFLLLSAAMPMLFLVRWWLSSSRSRSSSSNRIRSSSSGLLLRKQHEHDVGAGSLSPKRGTHHQSAIMASSSTTNDQALLSFDVLKSLLNNNNNNNDISSTTIATIQRQYSDIVELHHCQIHKLIGGDPSSSDAYANFTTWATPIVNRTVTELIKQQQSQNSLSLLLSTRDIQAMQDEFVLELLEIQANVQGLCDYTTEKYHPSVPHDATSSSVVGKTLQSLQDKYHDEHKSLARIAFVIVAFQDVDQLVRLVEAIHMAQHFIIIHLEEHASEPFRKAVQERITALQQQQQQKYENVVILQFGTVVYRTDSVSMINLRIMRWLIHELELEYDYHVTLDGAAFPLVKAQHLLAQRVTMTSSLLLDGQRRQRRSVWLGEATHRGERVRRRSQLHYLRHKRLIFTRGGGGTENTNKKLNKRLPRSLFAKEPFPESISDAMQYKSFSGNQAIFSYDVVRDLLDSPEVMQLFALSKYGCCCCLEERNWIAALQMIGYGQEALEQAAMFQVWGGETECGSSMKNALLSQNASLCYRHEDATAIIIANANNENNNNKTAALYFRGNETWKYLEDAKKRGMLFARKFHSDYTPSMALLADIQEDLW